MEAGIGKEPGHNHRTTYKSKLPTRSTKAKVELAERKGSCGDPKPPKNHTTVRSSKLSKTIGAKENLPPNKCGQALSSTDSLLLLPKPKKPAIKSMGYMEMKRLNQSLVSEIQSMRESSESGEMKHLDAINQLAQEIAEQKKVHAELKSEMEHYQQCLATKNSQLDALQQSLEAIKFENEQLAAVLEGAKLDAATGLRIQEGIGSATHRHKMELEWEVQHKELDTFIVGLESTISQLKAQESLIDSHSQSLTNSSSH